MFACLSVSETQNTNQTNLSVKPALYFPTQGGPGLPGQAGFPVSLFALHQ